jgi:hypothetical protein
LAYISDTHLYATSSISLIFYLMWRYCSVSAAANTSRLKRMKSNSPSALGMSVRCKFSAPLCRQRLFQASLDHSVTFYKYATKLPLAVQMFKLLSETTLTVVTGCYTK